MAEYPATDWGYWTPEEYQVGAPATALHFERWFRNVVAAFQGATGAQRLHLGALERLNAGEELRCYCDPEQTSPAANFTFFGFSFIQLGEIRLSAELSRGGGSTEVLVQRLRAGAITNLVTWNAGIVYAYYSVDFSVWPGDAVRLFTPFANINARNIKLKTGGSDLFPGAYWPNTTQSPSPFVTGNRGIAW